MEPAQALVDLADAMRVEGLARLSYSGSNFEVEARKLIRDREVKREIFEKALSAYVSKLVKA